VFINNFIFQAEDGIRDRNVTGVQTCALPIFEHQGAEARPPAVGLQPLEAVPVPLRVGLRGRAEPAGPAGAAAHSAAASAKVAVSMTARKCTSPATTRS